MKTMLGFSILALTLAGCVPSAENAEANPATPEVSGGCDASKLDYAIGKTLDAALETKLKQEAQASVVRVAPHDGAITMDYSPERLNLFIDQARKIIRINCG